MFYLYREERTLFEADILSQIFLLLSLSRDIFSRFLVLNLDYFEACAKQEYFLSVDLKSTRDKLV